MQAYIAIVNAKPGRDQQVADFYQQLQPLLKQAEGYMGRKIYRSQNGTMADWVQNNYSAEERAGHPEHTGEDGGTQFILVETWASVDARMRFTKDVLGARMRDLIPHLLPEHSHEFYQEILQD